jgi:DNA-directed RNA polymerase specialized sigma subunit
MTTLQINDPWFESLYKTEFHANPNEFLKTFKSLLSEKREREQRIISLLESYKNAEMSVATIAEKLNIDRDEVLSLMNKHNIYLIDEDYDLSLDNQTVQEYLVN